MSSPTIDLRHVQDQLHKGVQLQWSDDSDLNIISDNGIVYIDEGNSRHDGANYAYLEVNSIDKARALIACLEKAIELEWLS